MPRSRLHPLCHARFRRPGQSLLRGSALRRHFWWITSIFATAALCGCAAPRTAARPAWVAVTDLALRGGGAQGVLQIAAVLPGSGPAAWLLGGDRAGAGPPQVAMWSASSPSGPWTASRLIPVPGRDGPEETILGFARTRQTGRTPRITVAFGSHASPTEGYPRASTWVGEPSVPKIWREVVADRELFGGPNSISLGQITSGPHGFTIAGAWNSTANRAVAVVWRSSDGVRWVRDDTDPALAGRSGETPSADDVADSPAGLVLVGAAGAPRPGAPAYERGAIWYSATGSSWARIAPTDPSLTAATQTVVDAVRSFSGGWLAAGARQTGVRAIPTVWTIGFDHRLGATTLPGSTRVRTAAVTGLAVTPVAAVVAGVEDGAPRLWCAPVRGGGPDGWRTIDPPPGVPPTDLRKALVAAGGGWIVVVLTGTRASAVWRARWSCPG